MQEADRPDFGQLVTDVHAFYRQDCSRFVLDVWWAACEPFDMEQVRRAFTLHAKDPEAGKFCPKPADLVKALAGTSTDRAALAWGKVHEAMGAVGAYQDVVFDDPAIHAVVEDLGGWPKLCRTDTKELGYVQHRFTESHRAYTGKGAFEYPRRLMGDRSPDSEYERKGLPLPAPVLVGNQVQAQLVFERGSASGKTAITFSAASAVKRLSGPGAQA
jgi:hypothetical protein